MVTASHIQTYILTVIGVLTVVVPALAAAWVKVWPAIQQIRQSMTVHSEAIATNQVAIRQLSQQANGPIVSLPSTAQPGQTGLPPAPGQSPEPAPSSSSLPPGAGHV